MGRGSALTRVSHFGTDPFTSEENQVRAEGHFTTQYPDLTVLFNNVVNYNLAPFKNALISLFETTRNFLFFTLSVCTILQFFSVRGC